MNLLITGAWEQGQRKIPMIEGMGHHVVFMRKEQDTMPCCADWVEGVICNGLFLHHPIESLPNLRYIQLTSAGFDRVPIEYIQKQEIEIYNASDVYSIPMAEHVLACALWFSRRLGTFQKNQQVHAWKKQRDLRQLHGKNVLIIGCGHVGRACAKNFNAMGCLVTGIDNHAQMPELFFKIYPSDALKDCLDEADFIILSLPLTSKTQHMINDEALSHIKNEAVLINISRGGVIDTEALIRHLPRIGGAALDVFEEEPLCADSPLWDFENVLITPHNSFVGDENQERLDKVILNNLRKPHDDIAGRT